MFSEDRISKRPYMTAYTTLKTVTSTRLEGRYHMNLHSTEYLGKIDLLDPWGKKADAKIPSIKMEKGKSLTVST